MFKYTFSQFHTKTYLYFNNKIFNTSKRQTGSILDPASPSFHDLKKKEGQLFALVYHSFLKKCELEKAIGIYS